MEDLEERGLLESTLVIAMGEFGRTPIINPNLGRDHWPNCWSLALAGGGIKTGQVVGASDERGANVTERVVTMGDLYATIYQALGIDWKKEYMSPIGRPIKIANSLDDRTGSACEGIAGVDRRPPEIAGRRCVHPRAHGTGRLETHSRLSRRHQIQGRGPARNARSLSPGGS